MKKKHIAIPAALLVYLAVMGFIGYGNYKEGSFSALHYYGTMGGTLLVIVVLFFSLRKRERLRREREDDMRNNERNDEK